MQIHVSSLPAEGMVIEFDEPLTRFPVLHAIETDGECRFMSTIRGHVTVRIVQEMVTVTGTIQTRARFTCARCLGDYETTLKNRFSLSFIQQLPDNDEEETELALCAEDLGLVPYQGDDIDLQDALSEQVVLALPLRPLCDENCKGLCPSCGANLNKKTCRCRHNDTVDPRLAVLKSLKLSPD